LRADNSLDPRQRRVLARSIEERRRAALRRRQLGIVSAILIVLGLVIYLVMVQLRAETDSPAGQPRGVTEGGLGISIPSPASVNRQSPTPDVKLLIYYDLDCEGCATFFAEVGPYLDGLRNSGTASIEHRPVAFLSPVRGDDYSARALNAAACVLTTSGGSEFAAYVGSVFEHQPPTGMTGLKDDELSRLAESQSGAQGVRECIRDDRYEQWVQRVTTAFTTEPYGGINTVPSVFVNGRLVSSPVTSGVARRVSAADIQMAIDELGSTAN